MKRTRNNNASMSYPAPDYLALALLLVQFFFILFVYVLLESIIVPMTKDLYAWTSEFAIKTIGIGLMVIGVLAFLVFILYGHLTKRFDDRKVYIFLGLCPMLVSMLLHLPLGNNYALMQDCSSYNESATPSDFTTSFITAPTDEAGNSSYILAPSPVDDYEDSTSTYSRVRRALVDEPGSCDALGCPTSQEWCKTTPIIELWQIIVGNLFGVFGYPIAFTAASSLLSKMTSPAAQGSSMGVLTSVGSFSRMMGPLFVTWTYTAYGTLVTFAILSIVLALCVISAIAIYNRLVPMDLTGDACRTVEEPLVT